MRYAVLLLLCSFGALLLWLAGYRYQAVNAELGSLNTVEGIVDSNRADGALHLKYKVGAEHFEIVRSIPVPFPRLRVGSRVTLLYDPARPDTARVWQWSVIYPDSAVAAGFGLAAIFMGVAGFVMMGKVPSPGDTSNSAPPAQLDLPI